MRKVYGGRREEEIKIEWKYNHESETQLKKKTELKLNFLFLDPMLIQKVIILFWQVVN